MFKSGRSKKILSFLVVAVLLILAAVVVMFINYRSTFSGKQPIVISVDDEANIAIGKIHQTATRDGKNEWSLEAGSAKYLTDRKQALFERIRLTFFMKKNKKIILTADRGTLKTDSNDITVTGNVVMEHEQFQLKTDQLDYIFKDRKVFTDSPVRVDTKAFSLKAEKMKIDLDTKRSEFEGNVQASFHENVDL